MDDVTYTTTVMYAKDNSRKMFEKTFYGETRELTYNKAQNWINRNSRVEIIDVIDGEIETERP